MSKKRFALVRRTLGLALLQTALFVLIILAVCTATPLHIALLRALDASGQSGFSDSEIVSIAHAMTAVMRGADREILSSWFTADEVLHMKDVQWLFGVGCRLLAVLAVVSAICLVPGGRRLSRLDNMRCSRWALCACMLLPLLIAIPFAIDFTGMFVFLHRLAFPENELWLMDPRIHKMVVVYSEPFFISAVCIIGAMCLVSIVPLVVAAARGFGKDRSGADTLQEELN